MSEMINITINGREISVEKGKTILEAANDAGIYIPRLCYLKEINDIAACRVCVVEIEGYRTLKNSCTIEVTEGMNIKTKSDRVKDGVTTNLELLSASHVFECWTCEREGSCEFYDLLGEFDVHNELGNDPSFSNPQRVITESDALVLDSGKCVTCGRCISTCEKVTTTGVLTFNNRGFKTIVGVAGDASLEDAGCIACGQCIQACPVAAIKEKDSITEVQEAISNPDKVVFVQTAPAVRAAIGEEFGLPIGTPVRDVEGKMYHSLKKLGFDHVTDVNFGADLTVIEEGNEFIQRLNNGGKFPMFTSCSPGWINYIEQYQQKYIENLSTCKSPHMMQGALTKHYLAEKMGISKENIVVVSIMPCVAKKHEANRPEMEHEGLRDVDFVLTTRELGRMIRNSGINFLYLEDDQPDNPFATFTGAATIFGATGGVMEAALRTVVETLENRTLDKLDFEMVRGTEDIKEATLNVNGQDINVAVVHGGAGIKHFFEILETTDKEYHLVEFMGCSGGCINGGGQPHVKPHLKEKIDIRTLRAQALYEQDAEMTLRKSHENPVVKKLYNEFLGEPLGHKSHELLHTSYNSREIYSAYKK